MVWDQYDVTRRETLAAIGLTGAVGFARPAAIANAQSDHSASNAAYLGSTEEMPRLSDYGTVEQGGDISSVLATAIADAASNNTRLLRIPSGSYTVPSTVKVNADDLTIVGLGAVISTDMTTNAGLFLVTGTNVTFEGLRLEFTSGSATGHFFRVNGDDCHIRFCDLEYTAGGVLNANAMYIRDADGFQMIGCTKRGSNAFIGNFSGSNALIAFNTAYGGSAGDDFFAIKAWTGVSENIRVIGNHVHQHASILSIGSNVGTNLADDPTYSKYVRNVTCIGNVGTGCGYLALIKPGALSTHDYRNGLVEDVTISDNILTDIDAVKFAGGIEIKAGRAAIIRNVRGSNNIIHARMADSASGTKVAGFNVLGTGLGGTPTIEDIDVSVIYIDPHAGAASGTAGTVGKPADNVARVDPANLSLGNINLRIEGDGCRETGVYIMSGGDHKVTIEKLKLKNYNVDAFAAAGGLRVGSLVKIVNANAVSMSGTGSAYVVDTGGGFTGSIGYGISGTVTQATSKTTGVSLDYTTGRITTTADALPADNSASFTLTNARIQANDILVLNHVSGGTSGAYMLNAQCAAGSAKISIRNVTTGALSEAIVIGFAVVRTS